MKHLKMYEENIEDVKIVLDTCIFEINVDNTNYAVWYNVKSKKVSHATNRDIGFTDPNFILGWKEMDKFTEICNEHIQEFIKKI
jgi:hypothetical protein